MTLVFVLAHNILFAYVAPFLGRSGLASRTDAVLLLFGIAALVGIRIVGSRIDRSLRALTQISIVAFCGAGLALATLGENQWAVLAAVSVWGVAFGGAGSLFQTASARVSGKTANVAQSMIVTAWNLAIAGGGVLGGLLLQSGGAAALRWSLVALLALVGLLVLGDRRTGFARDPSVHETELGSSTEYGPATRHRDAEPRPLPSVQTSGVGTPMPT